MNGPPLPGLADRADALWERAAVAVMGDSRPDVAREALRIARAESRSRPVLLVDLLGQGSALEDLFGDDDPHGVSDAARYGVSLARVARPVPNADSLFVVPGGAESPLADDVLADRLWGSWSEQCRRAGALLVVAAPADLPAVNKAIDQLDGVVMVGDAPPPATEAPLLGRVPTPRRRTPADVSRAPRRVSPVEIEKVRRSSRSPRRRAALLLTGGVVLLLAAGALGVRWVSSVRTGPAGRPASGATVPIVVPGDPIPTEVAAPLATAGRGDPAPWTVELASVNSPSGAMARVRQVLDSVPVPTFAPIQPGGGSVTWYRLLAGAYPTREGADSLLASLRLRGALAPGAGAVLQAPLAWLLEEGVPDDALPARLFAWRQQGLPAYALIDPAGVTRVYVGAFASEAEARLLAPVLDSLTLHATLVPRVGSAR